MSKLVLEAVTTMQVCSAVFGAAGRIGFDGRPSWPVVAQRHASMGVDLDQRFVREACHLEAEGVSASARADLK